MNNRFKKNQRNSSNRSSNSGRRKENYLEDDLMNKKRNKPRSESLDNNNNNLKHKRSDNSASNKYKDRKFNRISGSKFDTSNENNQFGKYRKASNYNSNEREFNRNKNQSIYNLKQERYSSSNRITSNTFSEKYEYSRNINNDKEQSSSNEMQDLVWGRHSAEAVLQSERPIHRIWCTSELKNSPKFLQLLREAKSIGVLIEEVTWARLAQITKGAVHQGIVIQKAASQSISLNDLISGCSGLKETPLLLALDGLTDPQNLGAIIRSAEALGAHGIILPQRRSAGLTGSVAKVAAGALEHLPVARVVNLNRSLEKLKESGYSVIGLAEEGDVTLPESSFEGPLVVVIGSENKGISLVTRRICDEMIRIPLRGITPSLNASVATSILLYEIAKNSWMKRISGQAPSPKLSRAQIKTSINEE